MADLSSGFWSETDASNNNASPNGWPEGMMPSGVNDAARADKGALKRFWDRINPLQTITPSGGIWTFTTGNASYPSAYVNGEIFAFACVGNSANGDYFRVNALPARPIYTAAGGAYTVIKPFDIATLRRAFLVYDNNLAAGAGGFLLLNPFTPVANDGTGSGTMTGNLNVSGSLTVGGPINGSGNCTVIGNLTASGGILYLRSQQVMLADILNTGWTSIFDNSAAQSIFLGNASTPINLYRQGSHQFQARSGTPTYAVIDATGFSVTGAIAASGTLTCTGVAALNGAAVIGGWGIRYSTFDASNLIGFSYAGTSLTAYVNGTSIGPVVTAPGGNINISANVNIGAGTLTATNVTASNDVNAPHLYVSAFAQITGTLTVSGAVTLNAGGTALSVPSGNVSVGGTLTAAAVSSTGTLSVAGQSSFNGAVTIGGAVTINAGGTALNLTGGNLMVAGNAQIVGALTINGGGTGLTLTGGTGAKPGGGTWADSSDIRTKEADSIADYTTGLAAVRRLRPRTFRKNGRGGTVKDGKTYIGLVADEALPVMPEMIGRIEQRLDPDDAETTDILTLDATALIYALTNAVQTLAADLDALKAGEPHAADGPTPQPRPHRR